MIIIQDTIPKITTIFPMIIGYGSLTARTDELNTTPSKNNSLPPKMCKAYQGPPKGEDRFPSAPFLLGTMAAISFRECIDPCVFTGLPPSTGEIKRLTLRLVKQDTGYTLVCSLSDSEAPYNPSTNLIDMGDKHRVDVL